MGSDRVFDGEIREGFDHYSLVEDDIGESNVAQVTRVGRKHRFGKGYQDHGRPQSLTKDLTTSDARAVRDLLDDWLAERDSEQTENEDQ